MNLGSTIKDIRKKREPKLNQAEFASSIGITQTYLSQIESNKKTPNISVLEEISKLCEIPLPIIFWLSIEEKDIKENKRQYFISIIPLVNNLINDLY